MDLFLVPISMPAVILNGNWVGEVEVEVEGGSMGLVLSGW